MLIGRREKTEKMQRVESENTFQQIGLKYDPNDQTRPVGRSGHCMCSDQSDFYVFGGYSPADIQKRQIHHKVLSKLWKFNYASEEWSKLETQNTPKTGYLSCIKIQNKQLLLFGGSGYPFTERNMSNTAMTVTLKQPEHVEHLCTDGTSTPHPVHGTSTPHPVDGTSNPHPVDGTSTPHPVDGTSTPHPVDGTSNPHQSPQPLTISGREVWPLPVIRQAYMFLAAFFLSFVRHMKTICTNTVRQCSSWAMHVLGRRQISDKPKSLHNIPNVWQIIETTPMSYTGEENMTPPKPAFAQCLIFHKEHMYVFGGNHGPIWAPLHRLNTKTLIWEALQPTGQTPIGRTSAEVAEDSENFYIFGGGRLLYAESLRKVYKYNYSQNNWEELITTRDPKHGFPKSRCSFGLVQEGPNVYVSGGEHYGRRVNHQPLSDCWHFRLDTLQWMKLKLSLPRTLYSHTCVISPAGYMFIFGGVLSRDREYGEGTRSPYIYKVRLPGLVRKLVELSWEAVCVPLRKEKRVTKENLALLGVPWDFVDRASL